VRTQRAGLARAPAAGDRDPSAGLPATARVASTQGSSELLAAAQQGDPQARFCRGNHDYAGAQRNSERIAEAKKVSAVGRPR